MFGHQDDRRNDDDNKPMVTDAVADSVQDTDKPEESSSFNPALPSTDSTPFGSTVTPSSDHIVAPADSLDKPAEEPVTAATPVVAAAPADSDLLALKQQALTSLSPLVDHLDQTPEEKFRTTMMMIQASDNQELVKTAYEAANQITDEKVKAQALLDIVNEINYFTQQHSS